MAKQENLLKKHPVKNLYTYPLHETQPFIKLTNHCTLIIPDLHANPLLLLHYLLRTKIMHWPDHGEQYWQRIVNFYKELVPQDETALAAYLKKFDTEFAESLLSATFMSSHPLLFLGDIFADRGQNDWFMLLLLDVLHKKNIAYKINFSNHDCDMYYWTMLDKFSDDITSAVIASGQRVSLINFNGIYRHANNTQKKRMRELYHHVYLPYVTLFAYAFNKNTKNFVISTHAPGSFKLIRDVADELKLTYDDLEQPAHLIKLLDACNATFQQLLSTNPETFKENYTPIVSWRTPEKHYPAIVRALWGRTYEYTKSRHPKFAHYTITWICGHLGPKSHPQCVTNLDASNLGKREFGMLYTFEHPKKPMIDCVEGNLCYSTSAAEMVS